MSDKPIESYGRGFLVLLLPISFLIIFLVATWRMWLAAILLVLAFNIWQRYQWQRWSLQVNPIFHKLIQENQGRITSMDLALKGNFSGEKAKRFLEHKAKEFGAKAVDSEDQSNVYYFITSSTLGSILDISEPPKELISQSVAKTAFPFLAPPLTLQQQELETQLPPPPTQEEVKRPLEKQLIFGSLIQSELAKRLNVYSSTVYKRRDDPEFPEWSRNRDPDGIAWTYSREIKEFFPLEEGKS